MARGFQQAVTKTRFSVRFIESIKDQIRESMKNNGIGVKRQADWFGEALVSFKKQLMNEDTDIVADMSLFEPLTSKVPSMTITLNGEGYTAYMEMVALLDEHGFTDSKTRILSASTFSRLLKEGFI
ncbi:MAG: hypothetical protein HRU38_24250 [Saccharospirillaceae bacterium]|nr:hypothetical protein [Pseudomonadales bacterium]NRB81734.1 hypothetical protein [Saccharospirillaceae bacterium]